MKAIIVLMALLFSASSYGQINIKFLIKDFPDKKIDLLRIETDQLILLDSAYSQKGIIQFVVPKGTPAGMYRIMLGQLPYQQSPASLDILVYNEDIEMATVYPNLFDSLIITKSFENKLYMDFLKEEQTFNLQLELIQQTLDNYPKKDAYMKATKEKYNSLQREREQFISDIEKKHPNSLAARIISRYKSPFMDADKTPEERYETYVKNYFSGIDFTDTLLLNTTIYTDKLFRYIRLYMGQRLSPTEQEKEFIKAVDIIIPAINHNTQVYSKLLEYMLKGFESLKMETVLTHISTNYMAESCENENKTVLQKRLEAYQKMAVGKHVPDISITDVNGKEITLNNPNKNYTLLVFWASWCPHCVEMMPELFKYATEIMGDKLNVITISIDTNKSDWEETVKSLVADNWKNTCDLKGWDGKTVHDYNIYATPTMFLINKDKEILVKPITLYELKNYFK